MKNPIFSIIMDNKKNGGGNEQTYSLGVLSKWKELLNFKTKIKC